MTLLRISDAIFQAYPQVVIGVLIFTGANNRGERPELAAALRQEEARIIERFADAAVKDIPQIACWREAYRQFGSKPTDYPSSIENHVRRVLKGHRVSHINPLVDAYNLISLRHLLPVGGEDLDQIEGDVELAFAGENESPVRLLGEPEERAPRPGEVIYKDQAGAICRRWNWKEAERTRFTEDTTRGFLVMEGLPPLGRAEVEAALEELAALVQTHCGAQVRTGILSRAHPDSLLDIDS